VTAFACLFAKNNTCIVVGLRDVGEAKFDIRTAPFELKKIDSLHAKPFLGSAFIKSAEKAGRYFAGTTGSVISSFLPKAIQESADELGTEVSLQSTPEETLLHNRTKPDYYVTQGIDEERLAYYRSIIREQFVRRKSVFFIVPTIIDCNRVFATLSKGIGEYAHIIHSGLPSKKYWRNGRRLWHKTIQY